MVGLWTTLLLTRFLVINLNCITFDSIYTPPAKKLATIFARSVCLFYYITDLDLAIFGYPLNLQ